MGADGDGVEFEGEAGGVELGVDVAGFLRFVDGAGDGADPFVHNFGDAVAYDAEAAVEFERSGGEEAAAFKDAFFDEDEPMIDQRPEARDAFGGGDGGASDFVDEDLAGHFYGSELEFFFGAEMSKEAAFAHAELFCEGANGEAFEALCGGDVDGAGEDRFAGAEAFGVATGDGFVGGLTSGLSNGTRAQSTRH